MKRRRFLLVTIAVLVVLGAIFLASVGAYVVLPSGTTGAWDGHYPLLVNTPQDCDQLVDRLDQAGFDRVIAECTATVTINTFGDTQEIALDSVPTRFDNVDPRIDPYIRALPSWFRSTVDGRPVAIVYVASGESPYRAYRRIAAAMDGSGGTWYFPDWNRGASLVFPVAFLIVVALLVSRGSGFRFAVLCAALPWPVWLFRGGLPSFSAAAVIYTAWVVGLELMVGLLRRNLSDAARTNEPVSVGAISGFPLLAGLTPVLAATVVTLVLHADPGIAVRLPILLNAAGTITVGLFVLVLRVRRYRSTDHPLFTPVAIVRTRPNRPATVFAALPLVVAVILAAPLVHRIIPQGVDAYLPEPERPPAPQPLTLEALAELWVPAAEGRLPNIADYVAHRAFQEGFMYRRAYGLPVSGEALEQVRFVRNGATVDRLTDTIVEYNEVWLYGVLANLPPRGIERLLLAQPSPVRVVLRATSAIYFDRSSLARHAILMILLVVPFLVLFLRDAAVFHRSRSLLQRSNRQHA